MVSQYELPGPGYVAYVFAFLGSIIICRLYKLTLSNQPKSSAIESQSLLLGGGIYIYFFPPVPEPVVDAPETFSNVCTVSKPSVRYQLSGPNFQEDPLYQGRYSVFLGIHFNSFSRNMFGSKQTNNIKEKDSKE